MKSVNEVLDGWSKILYGALRTEALEKRICVRCKAVDLQFVNERSRKEYELTAFCERCQDKFYGVEA